MSGTSFRVAVRDGREVVGTFLNTGSPLVTEIVASAGADWVLIDLEHGAGDEADLLGHIHASSLHGSAPIVRVEAAERMRICRALDFGAAGLMLPRIESPDEVCRALSYMRYPPDGQRGVSLMARANRFGAPNTRPIHDVNNDLVLLVQIETVAAVECVEQLASIPGVDVLFLGPSDLSHAFGAPGQFAASRFQEAARAVADAASASGCQAGVLLRSLADVPAYRQMGYRVFAIGSDGAMLSSSMASTVRWFAENPLSPAGEAGA